MLQEQPVSAVKVKELCERAGINRTTFYLHYGSPGDVLKDIEKDFSSETEEYLTSISPSLNDVMYIQAYLDFVEKNADVYRILLIEPQYREFQRQFLQEMIRIIQREYAPTVPEEIQAETYAFILHGNMAIIRNWMDSNFQKDKASIAQLMYDLSDNALIALENYS